MVYPVFSLQDIIDELSKLQQECPGAFPIAEWTTLLRAIDKLPNWGMRKRAESKIIPLLDTLRSKKLPLKQWRQAYRLFHTIADWYVLGHNDVPLFTYDTAKVAEMNVHFSQPSTNELPVIITMTSCKRLDLLTRTINSMLQNCLDLTKYIREWILIDDNSSGEDRARMRELYPFITFINKSVEDKGHPRSMNMLQTRLLQTDAKYNFHIEDDFEWWYPDQYLSKLVHVLELDKSFGQVSVNFEYSEDAHQTRDIWNRDMHYTQIDSKDVRYFIHEYYTGERLNIESNHLRALSSMYWPHFTFRPALTKMDVYRKIGAYEETPEHFEMKYAHRYIAKGYRTAMLDCCYTTHIGRRTYERNSDKLNAYDLNQEHQFGEKPKKVEAPLPPAQPETTPALNLHPSQITKIRTFVINLRRRPERLLQFLKRNNNECPSFEVFDGVDGKNLQPDVKIHKIFETSDYNYRRGIVGCAYSHLKIWHEFVKGKSEYCLVLEDDVQLTNNFRDKLLYLVQNNQFDLLFLHWNPYRHIPNQESLAIQFEKPSAEVWSMERSIRDNMGSGAAYVLTRHGAKHMIRWVNEKGMPNAVDWNLFKQPQLRVMYSKPMLAFGTCWQNNTTVDSDIQKEYDCVKFASQEAVVLHEIRRWIAELQPDNKEAGVVYKTDVGVWKLPAYQESIVCICGDEYLSYGWDIQQQRVFVMPSSVNIPRSLPVKWYNLGAYKIVVPDLLISKKMYEDTVWFDNRLNFSKV